MDVFSFIKHAAAAALALASCVGGAHAGEAKIAVAANFTQAAKEIGEAFEKETGHEAVFSFGATGQLYAQISQGAPFDVLLAADQARPEKAVAEGFAVAGSRFTYAVGKIVLYSTDKFLVTGDKTLRSGGFHNIAIANPVTAPYGATAVDVMKALGVYEALRTKLVRGGNIAQTYQFVATGAAELGFVALSQIATHGKGSRWTVPEDLYSPIAQDAVLLRHGEGNEAAEAFITFLKGAKAHAIIERYGYGAPTEKHE
ncbi:molybdate ABC transporter substrate-binding protein [Hyphococcus luteus]|uniref:Molybdate ABC transporter substrate-binding protein n=1 Tax=Hyphococcus luteus TaxID=2058213 RepID=A0A2S7K0N9_9PROT|nr:molybdate ABC transporter substrate-binding protein [Marinicaulis flavus]PQA86069.1 molybdate ABC transporter substrate-binding protein [Marinicaulis flavus]